LDRIKNEDYRSAVIAFLIAVALLLAMLMLPAQWSLDLAFLGVLLLPPLLGSVVAGGGFALGSLAVALCFAAGCALDAKLTAVLAAACLPFAFTAGYVIRKKIRFRHSVMSTSAAALVGALLSIGVLWLLTNQMPVDFFISRLNSSFSFMNDTEVNSLYQILRSADLMTGAVTQAALNATARIDAIAYMVNQFKEVINYNLVTMIGVYSLLMGLIGYLIPRAVLKRRQADVIEIPSFSEFTLPNRFWLAFILSYLFALIGESLGWPGFGILVITVDALYGLMLMVQGLSFLDYLYKRRKMGTAARVALHTLILVISSLPSFVGTLLVWLGLLENVAHLRKRMETKGGTVL
jgi:uncharacterized protein YybS (DUF2232 family)